MQSIASQSHIELLPLHTYPPSQRGRDNEQDRRYDRNEAAINHLKRLYSQYKAARRPMSPRTGGGPRTPSPAGSDEDFFKMLPLFCNAFGKVCLRVILLPNVLLMECVCTYVCSVCTYTYVNLSAMLLVSC